MPEGFERFIVKVGVEAENIFVDFSFCFKFLANESISAYF